MMFHEALPAVVWRQVDKLELHVRVSSLASRDLKQSEKPGLHKDITEDEVWMILHCPVAL